jgi:hypothetical protein
VRRHGHNDEPISIEFNGHPVLELILTDHTPVGNISQRKNRRKLRRFGRLSLNPEFLRRPYVHCRCVLPKTDANGRLRLLQGWQKEKRGRKQ